MRFVEGPRGGDGGTFRRLLYNLRLPSRLARARPDLIVGFDLDGFWIAGRTRRPYVLCLKGILADELRYESGRERWRLALLALLERRNARRAGVVVVPSRYSRDVAIRRYGLDPDRVRVVPEGIDPDEWAGHSEGAVEPAARHTRRAEVTILSVARQYRRKNTATLLRAFRDVRRARPEARLRVVGGGPELARLRRLSRELGLEGVHFLGELPEAADVRREYHDADVFCLPSLQEGFGIVFLEAMAAGLPIVASSAGAIPEVVPDGRVGRLVDPADPQALAGALLLLATDGELRSRMGAAGRRHARRFAWPRIARAFLRAAEPPVS